MIAGKYDERVVAKPELFERVQHDPHLRIHKRHACVIGLHRLFAQFSGEPILFWHPADQCGPRHVCIVIGWHCRQLHAIEWMLLKPRLGRNVRRVRPVETNC